MTLTRLAALTVGTLLGGFARYGLAGLVHRGVGAGFPYGTLAVNLTGCLAIGVLDALAEQKFVLGPEARLLLMTGFCGAFTTFSTLVLESDYLLLDGQVLGAAVNLGASVALGLAFVRLGRLLGGAL